MIHKLPARLGLGFLLLALAGCSTFTLPGEEPTPVPGTPQSPAPDTPPPIAPQPPPRPSGPTSSSAWRPLLQQAEQARGRGDYEQALALLERAQRIDPDSGEIYLQLAKTHRARGDNVHARATAERGLLYCSTKPECDALRSYAR